MFHGLASEGVTVFVTTRYLDEAEHANRVATIHNRMPVILTEHGERLWLDRDAPPEESLTVLAPYPADLMETWPVSTAVNRAGRDAPEMVEPLAS